MTQMPPTYPNPMGQPTGMKPHRGTMILVFGILGFVVCFIFGIVAWVMGNADMKEMDAGTMDPTGRGMTQAGKICGMISTILAACIIVLYLIIIIIGIGAAAAGAAGGGGVGP